VLERVDVTGRTPAFALLYGALAPVFMTRKDNENGAV
jgi:hypothetical protein